jgi:hypothetical protein
MQSGPIALFTGRVAIISMTSCSSVKISLRLSLHNEYKSGRQWLVSFIFEIEEKFLFNTSDFSLSEKAIILVPFSEVNCMGGISLFDFTWKTSLINFQYDLSLFF